MKERDFDRLCARLYVILNLDVKTADNVKQSFKTLTVADRASADWIISSSLVSC